MNSWSCRLEHDHHKYIQRSSLGLSPHSSTHNTGTIWVCESQMQGKREIYFTVGRKKKCLNRKMYYKFIHEQKLAIEEESFRWRSHEIIGRSHDIDIRSQFLEIGICISQELIYRAQRKWNFPNTIAHWSPFAISILAKLPPSSFLIHSSLSSAKI